MPVLFHKKAAGQNKSLPLQKIAYNRFGFPEKISTLDQNGFVVISRSIQYDDENRPTEIITGDAVLKLSYNPFGYCASLGSKNGKFATYYYDEFNRKIIEIGSTAKSLRYNNAGLLTQIREISNKDVILFSARLTYDFYGRLARMKDHKGRIVLSEYDPAGFLLKQTYPDNTSVAYQYDSEGNLVQVTDQRGNAIRFEYSANGLKRHITAENQVTEYEYNSQGRKVRMFSYFNKKRDSPDRDIRYRYDEFDRLISTDFGGGYIQNNLYDSWGNLKQIERISPAEKRVAEFDYDHFGRQTGQREEIFSGSMRKDTITRRLEFNTAGQRTLLQINHAGKTREIEYEYNEDGQLAKICSGNDMVVYVYTDGRLTKEIVNDIPISYDFDEMGRLLSKTLGEYASLKYFYAPNGDLTGREYNGRKILYEYDNLDQVTAVIDAESKQKLEEYVYDPTGNILKKKTNGKISEFRYDKANQLISGKIDEKTFQYRYDAAGRMISDGYSSWQYGWLNSVVKADKTSFSYDVSGQLASAGNEMFLWDNLALIERGDTPILNTPAATGGNPLLTGKSLVFHDMLGSSIGVFEGERFTAFHRTGFGETETDIDIKLDYFTGKPRVPLLGHNFLLRNHICPNKLLKG